MEPQWASEGRTLGGGVRRRAVVPSGTRPGVDTRARPDRASQARAHGAMLGRLESMCASSASGSPSMRLRAAAAPAPGDEFKGVFELLRRRPEHRRRGHAVLRAPLARAPPRSGAPRQRALAARGAAGLGRGEGRQRRARGVGCVLAAWWPPGSFAHAPPSGQEERRRARLACKENGPSRHECIEHRHQPGGHAPANAPC